MKKIMGRRFQTVMLLLWIAIPAIFALSQDEYNKSNSQQDRLTISGNVSDTKGEALIGVSIQIDGTTTGTVTNFDGDFTIQASRGDILKVMYIGFSTQNITVENERPLRIVMQEDTQVLDDLVVTALGIRRSEKALSYNVQEVKASEVTTIKDANFMNSLVGKVAGVTINQSAATGGATRVVMRGVKSINSSNLALYVIDGIPMYNMMNGGGESSIFSEQPGTDGVADINPEDIESISMLTGPSAAALYGNAAASGVVLITTKKGAIDKTSVTVSNNTIFSTVSIMPEMQSKYGNRPNEMDSWGSI
ncbi:MAG: TonB-dependent receptor plug domain-containing protein, partial [Tissierellia bacterium]|nr:TonB-dependent receptor plug domain-containing protein [Tissierellia bacterium]